MDINAAYKIRVSLNSGRYLPIYILLTLPLWVVTWLGGEQWMADVAALWAVWGMGNWGVKQVGNPYSMIRFLKLGSMSLVLIQNLTWLVASFLHRFSVQQDIASTLRGIGTVPITISSYAGAIIYATLFAFILALISSASSTISLENKLCLQILRWSQVKLLKLISIIVIFLVIIVFLILNGVIGQRTIVAEGFAEGKMPFWYSFYGAILAMLLFFLGLLAFFLRQKIKSGWIVTLLLFLGAFVAIVFVHFSQGRSPMLFAIFSIGFWFIFFLGKTPNWRWIFLTLILLYPLLSTAFLLNNFLRSGTARHDWAESSVVEVVKQGWSAFQLRGIEEEEVERTLTNLSSRPLVANPLARCMTLSAGQKNFLWGKEFLHSLIWTIPGPLFPNKEDYPKQEELLYANFPIGFKDTADSVYLSAYAEFGWLGLAIYPLLIFGCWYLVLIISLRFSAGPLMPVVSVSCFLQLFVIGIGEGAVNGWLVTLRTVLAFAGLLILVQRVRIRRHLGFFPKKTNAAAGVYTRSDF